MSFAQVSAAVISEYNKLLSDIDKWGYSIIDQNMAIQIQTILKNKKDLDNYINVVYVISERQIDGGIDKYIVQEYPVSIQDYSKIKIGQTVTLEVPDSRTNLCKVVKIE